MLIEQDLFSELKMNRPGYCFTYSGEIQDEGGWHEDKTTSPGVFGCCGLVVYDRGICCGFGFYRRVRLPGVGTVSTLGGFKMADWFTQLGQRSKPDKYKIYREALVPSTQQKEK